MSKLMSLSSASACAQDSHAKKAEPKTLVRHVLVNIAGNRTTWHTFNKHGALWRVNPERTSSIFSPDSTEFNLDVSDRLSRALIKKVTVLESNTNIDEVVSISIDGLPPKEFTSNGDGATLFLTGEGRVTTPQEVFSLSGDTELGLQWMQQFPRHTAENLHREGVMFLQGSTFYFVNEGHPVIHMLRSNEVEFGVQVQQSTQVDGSWYKIDTDTFIFCVKTIRETILHNAPSTFNLNTLTVRLAKPDGEQWLQLSPQHIDSLVPPEVRATQDPVAIQEARVKALDRYVDKPLFVTMRLAFEYALPDLPANNAPKSVEG